MRIPQLMLMAVLVTAIPAARQEACSWSRDLRLLNGKIHTLDPQDRVVNEVTIQEGRFAYIGALGSHKLNPCTKVIDLHGRVVVPGLIDNHNHSVLFSQRPGCHVMVETATSIPRAMAMLKERDQTTPPGAWVTAIGDWTPRLFAEKRAPRLMELDEAVPDHPVFFATFGPAVTNSLGKKFSRAKALPSARRVRWRARLPVRHWGNCASYRLWRTGFAVRSMRKRGTSGRRSAKEHRVMMVMLLWHEAACNETPQPDWTPDNSAKNNLLRGAAREREQET